MERKIGFNYADRLNNQLLAMAYNPKYFFVMDSLYELMREKNIFTRNFTQDKIYIPGCDEPAPTDTEVSYIDFKTYNELMIAARMITLVGKLPRNISHYNLSFLSGVKSEAVPFSDEDFVEIENDPDFNEELDPDLDYCWLHVGENDELKMLAVVDPENGLILPLLDYPVRSRFEDSEYIDKMEQYKGIEDGYEYISELFDYLYDPSENYLLGKEYQNYLTDFDEEETEEDLELEEDEEDWEDEDDWYASEVDDGDWDEEDNADEEAEPLPNWFDLYED